VFEHNIPFISDPFPNKCEEWAEHKYEGAILYRYKQCALVNYSGKMNFLCVKYLNSEIFGVKHNIPFISDPFSYKCEEWAQLTYGKNQSRITLKHQRSMFDPDPYFFPLSTTQYYQYFRFLLMHLSYIYFPQFVHTFFPGTTHILLLHFD
jgi:hypothetical protein